MMWPCYGHNGAKKLFGFSQLEDLLLSLIFEFKCQKRKVMLFLFCSILDMNGMRAVPENCIMVIRLRVTVTSVLVQKVLLKIFLVHTGNVFC